MDRTLTYIAGTPPRRIDLDALLDAIADQLLDTGDVEKALQRAFRLGTEDDPGLLDLLDRLRNADDPVSLGDEDVASEFSPEHHGADDVDSRSTPEQQQIPDPSDTAAMLDSLRQIESLDDLQRLDPELMQRALTPNEVDWIEKWADMTGQLIEAGLVVSTGSRLTLSAKAIHQIGIRLLRHMFVPPTVRGRGSHVLHRPGLIGALSDDTTGWEWGRPFDLDVQQSISNAVRHVQERGSLKITVDDFAVFERESGAAVATVLLTDMSRSMFESGAWDAAKRAAIALNTLVSGGNSRDHLDLVGFSGDARALHMDDLPSLTWDQFSHGTNLHAGLLLADRLLHRHRAMNRQVVIITDGEPTAYLDGSTAIFEHPVTENTIDRTLLQAMRMARKSIAFTTICVGESLDSSAFSRQLSTVVSGRLISVSLDELAPIIVRDVAVGQKLVM